MSEGDPMRRKLLRKQSGFSVVEALAVVFIIVGLAAGGWYEYHHSHSKPKPHAAATTSTTGTTKYADPYAGWKSAMSARAGFSFKYPADWTYSQTLGTKDNVEHITLDSPHFYLRMDSFTGTDSQSGGQPATTCADCLQVTHAQRFTLQGIGAVDLKTITYSLDGGMGNALILALPDDTYYIPSPTNSGIRTSFRGISALSSENAYRGETTQQFSSNPDYATAQKILQSITYRL